MRVLTSAILCMIAAGCSIEVPLDLPTPPTDVSGGETPECKDDEICLDVDWLPGAAQREGQRIAVAWYRVDQPESPSKVAFEAKFEPSEGRIAIPVTSIAAPEDDALLLCQRRCLDATRCPCEGDAKVGTATVVVSQDANQDGRIDAEEVRTAAYARASVIVGYSPEEYRPAPGALAATFPVGIVKGIAPYENLDEESLKLVPASGETFRLAMCRDPGTSCTPEPARIAVRH